MPNDFAQAASRRKFLQFIAASTALTYTDAVPLRKRCCRRPSCPTR